MKLIQDLGVKDFGTYQKRTGLYECPICKKHFETKTNIVKRSDCTKCRSCATTLKNITHGQTHHRLYSTWKTMKRRCFDDKFKNYSDYGKRGITVCERWLKVENFIEDMYSTYKEGLEIDRINNDGNYEPSNCRWTTRAIQVRNTRILRNTNTSGYRGVGKNGKNWKSRIIIDYKEIHLGTFKTAEEAGYAYDKYVIDNNLEHTTNGLYKE